MKLVRKLTSLLLVLCLALTVLALPASAATPFTDVPADAWFNNAVAYAYENGLFKGTGDTTFSPNSPMTRGMFVQVLANKTENYNKADWAGKSSFSDVNKSQWYAAPVEWASKAGLVSGMGGGKFAPNQNVTREQMALIMYNYAKKTGNDTSLDSTILSQFSDAGSVSSWAKTAMQWAVTHKIINGSGGKLLPGNNAKRCEVAQVAMKADPILVNNEVEIPDTPTPDPDPTPNPDPDFVDPTPDNLPEGALTYSEFIAAFPIMKISKDYAVDFLVADESNLSSLRKSIRLTPMGTLHQYAVAHLMTIKSYYKDFDNLGTVILGYTLNSAIAKRDITLWYYPDDPSNHTLYMSANI